MPLLRIARCLALTFVAILLSGAAAAQNIVGTWRLDPSRSNVRAPDGQPIADDEVLTIRVRGTFIDVSYPLHSLSGMGLPLGETLTVDTIEGRTHLVRVFTRQR